jgi:cell wall-associated NlpC family hydrolase
MTEPVPPARRTRNRLLIVLAVVAVTVAGVLVLVSRGRPAQVAATAPAPGPVASAPAPPSSSPVPPPATDRAAVPGTGGQEFDTWVGEVARWLDIPARAMTGYAKATVRLGKEQQGCHVSWVTLAAIGKVTTDHGRKGGARIGDDGRATKPIGTVEVRDFYGRVVSTPSATGPMQLPPALWQKWQRSAAGGKPDVQNVDDAALATGHALCDAGRNLTLGDDWWSGVGTLQEAPLFLHRVLATANVYGTVGKDRVPPNPAVLGAVNFAIDKIGLPYVWGGNGTEAGDLGFDCSGLTTAAYASTGITLKRTADWQFRSVPLIAGGTEPKLGDLIFYGNPATKIHHVGLYIGNQQMIDAPTFGQAVQVHSYRKPNDDYAGAGRPAS